MSDEETPGKTAQDCPIGECEGTIRALTIGGKVFYVCDGEAKHGDATIVGEWNSWTREDNAREEILQSERLRAIDGAAWARDIIHQAKQKPTVFFRDVDTKAPINLEYYPTGFFGNHDRLARLCGMVTLFGKASAGKSWFALGAALNAGEEGWNVIYLAAEGYQAICLRLQNARRSENNFRVVEVMPGMTFESLLDAVEKRIVSDKMLLVIDSISSMQAMMAADGGSNKWEANSKLEMFLMQVRARSEGRIGIMILSETNAQGDAKGRSIEHRSDMSLRFETSAEDPDVKIVTLTKSWRDRTGPLGFARIDDSVPGMDLSLIPPGGDTSPPADPDSHDTPTHYAPQGPVVNADGILEPPWMSD